MLIFSLFFALAFCYGSDVPASYFCRTTKLSEARWEREYEAMYKFQGIHSFVGSVYVRTPDFNLVKAVDISGVYHQYFDSNGLLWAETYVKGAPGSPPDVLVLSAKNQLSPIRGTNRVCQNYTLTPLGTPIYSEVQPSGDGYTSSADYLTVPESFGKVVGAGLYDWDDEGETAFSLFASVNRGNGHAQHTITLLADMRYTKVADVAQAVALGMVANPPVFNSARRVRFGVAEVPVELLPEGTRA